MHRRHFLSLISGLWTTALVGPGASRTVVNLPEHLVWPAAAIWHTDLFPAWGQSHFGGRPKLPANFEWPTFHGRPLDFLLQVDLAELAGIRTGLDLPATGRLLFFYDTKEQPWGLAPAHAGSARVVHIPEGAASERDQRAPESSVCFKPYHLRQITTLPNPWSVWVDEMHLTADQRFALDEEQRPHYHAGAQIGGHPDIIQDASMDLESELASSGYDRGDGPFSPYSETENTRLAKQWRLLLQVPSDESLGMSWGDDGTIYFWIREADLAKRDFSRVWVILQCF